jgi:tRNA A37 methylthiotransferase MiaB
MLFEQKSPRLLYAPRCSWDFLEKQKKIFRNYANSLGQVRFDRLGVFTYSHEEDTSRIHAGRYSIKNQNERQNELMKFNGENFR